MYTKLKLKTKIPLVQTGIETYTGVKLACNVHHYYYTVTIQKKKMRFNRYFVAYHICVRVIFLRFPRSCFYFRELLYFKNTMEYFSNRNSIMDNTDLLDPTDVIRNIWIM